MTIAKIHAAEYPIRKVFSNDFNFRIPLYQRPYSWTTEQAGELFDDLISFIGSSASGGIDDLSPYFLGSIVLIKEESHADAEVVDGQQRLTTLTILLSALRHSIVTPAYANGMTDYLYQEGKPLEGTPNRYRLTLRARDADFFRDHIQDQGSVAHVNDLNAGQLTDSQRNIRSNALLFLDRLAGLTEHQRVRLAQFIVKSCLLVVVSTPDLDSAYRIFSILNDRGLDLSHSDILKSEIIGRIPTEDQEAYNERWEDAEEELGRDAFGDLFGHVRMIYRKQKGRETVLKEFREYVIKSVGDATNLINKVLIPFADAFSTIRSANYESTSGAEFVNRMLVWLGRIDNTDWMPPAILFLARTKSNSTSLHRFFCDLERLAAFLMICKYGVNERIERYASLLTAIENGTDLFGDGSPLQLADDENRRFLFELDSHVYLQVPQRRMYILVRLDSALSDGSATYEHAVISIEHVLPQNPPEGSEWEAWFPGSERYLWEHRLCNLVLLNHKKNSGASNYGFAKKKEVYFAKGGVSPFPLTTQVLAENEWTPDVLERRQQQLIAKLRQIWRIDADLPAPIARDPIDDDSSEDGSEPAKFHGEIVPRLEKHFGKRLSKRSRVLWAPDDDSLLVSCQVSKRFNRPSQHFWFGLKRSTKEALEANTDSFCAFGLGNAENVLLIPFSVIANNLEWLNTSADGQEGILHWHIALREVGERLNLLLSSGQDNLDVSSYLLK